MLYEQNSKYTESQKAPVYLLVGGLSFFSKKFVFIKL